MEDSVATPMEVGPQGDSTFNSKNVSNDNVNETGKKTNHKSKRAMYRNKLRRAMYVKRKYLLLKNKANKNSQQKDGEVSSEISNNKTDVNQPRRRGTLVKNIHLQRNGIDISFNMSESEQQMLEFYKVKLSVLRSENENLHIQLENLAKENMRLIQMKPLLSSV